MIPPGLAVAVVAAAALDPAVALPPPAAPARPRVDLGLTLDPDGRRLAGTARLAIPNVTDRPLTEVRLWLYPNHLARRPDALGDINFHWWYPRGFSPAAMQIRTARAGTARVPVAVTGAPSPAGPDTVAQLPLPVPVPPGAVATLEVDFTATLPDRLGGFGCAGGRCRLMGGFYPYPLPLGPEGFTTDAPPDRVDFSMRVAAPAGVDLLIGGSGGSAIRSTGAEVTVAGHNVPYLTLVADRELHSEDVAAGGFRARLFHHTARRPPSSAGEVLPYVREDRVELVLDGVRAALAFLAEQGLKPPAPDPAAAGGAGAPPLTLVEAPLRHELVQAHGDEVLISDRLFELFPVERLRKFHRLELVRAVFTAALERALRGSEPDADVALGAEVMAAYLTEVFTLREFRRIEFARDLLRPLAFIPAVDQLIYAPLVASSASYFGDVEERDDVRDGVHRFSHRRSGGRLVYAKLLDLLGPKGMSLLGRTVLGERVPLRQAAARIFGADLGWFWRQWLGPPPAVNYRLARVQATPRPGGGAGGVRVTVDVERQGADLYEPVEVRVVDRAGAVHDLVWRDRGSAHRFELDLPAGLASVEVDPRRRLVERSLGTLAPADDPRADNRDPRRWRFIYSGFGALLDVTALQASFVAALRLKPQHDLHNTFLLLARHTQAVQIGVDASYSRAFGRQADRNRLTSELGLGIGVARLDPSFGVAATEMPQPGWRLSASAFLDHDDRRYLIDPWRAVGLSLGLGYSLTALDSGERLSQIGAGVELLRLFELAPGHVLAINLQAGLTAGDIRTRSQLSRLGGAAGLRGYGIDELFGRGRLVARVELRNRYLSDLDWNIAHFTAVRGFGGNFFLDAGLVTSCDDLSAGRDDIYVDAGYTFRVLHDAFGVYQQMLSIDVAVPLNRHDRICLGTRALAVPRPPVAVLISFLPAF